MISPGRFAAIATASATMLACTPAAPPATISPAARPPTHCQVRLGPPDVAARPAPLSFQPPLSQVVVGVSFDTSTLVTRLSSEIPPRVSSGRNIDAGIAGKLSYAIDRDPFNVAVREQHLVVSTSLHGRADLCKPLGPLGCVDYAGCSPDALATASIPLILAPDYRIGPAHVSIRITRSCRISGLGINATERIQRGADEQARRLRDRINRMLPSFRPGAEALWFAMGVRVPLGVQTRLLIAPEQVVQGPPTQLGSSVRIPLGVRARVSIQSHETTSRPSPALPPPVFDKSLAPGVDLDVPIEVDYESLSAELSRALSAPEHHQATTQEKILSARCSGDREGLLVVLSLHGHVCGDVAFLARPVYDERSGRIALRAVRPLPSEARRVRVHAPRLDLDAIARQVERHAAISLPILPDDIPRGLQRAAHLLRPDHGADVFVTVASSHVADIAVTERSLVLITRLRGSADVKLR